MSFTSALVTRRALTGLAASAALLGAAVAPQAAAASAKPHQRHHHAHRAQAPTTACSPDEMQMVGAGKGARLFVCDAHGHWTEALFAKPSTNGHTPVVNAGRA